MQRLLISIVLLLLAACAGRDPVLVATATCRSYAATLTSLAAFRAAGEIDNATADRVNEIRAFATPLCTGAPPTDRATLDRLEDRLYELLLAEQEARNAE